MIPMMIYLHIIMLISGNTHGDLHRCNPWCVLLHWVDTVVLFQDGMADVSNAENNRHRVSVSGGKHLPQCGEFTLAVTGVTLTSSSVR